MAQKYGYLANEEAAPDRPACRVCDDPHPSYSWTDYSGEGYCLRCGTPYQLKWGELKEGEGYPRLNIAAKWLPLFRKHYAETGNGNGSGTFMMGDDYPDQMRDRRAFNKWLERHKDEFPAQEVEPARTDDAVGQPSDHTDGERA